SWTGRVLSPARGENRGGQDADTQLRGASPPRLPAAGEGSRDEGADGSEVGPPTPPESALRSSPSTAPEAHRLSGEVTERREACSSPQMQSGVGRGAQSRLSLRQQRSATAPEEDARDRACGQVLLRPFHVQVQDRRDVEGQELRHQESADDGQAEGPPGF